MKRLFIGLGLPAEIREGLRHATHGLFSRLAAQYVSWRPTAIDNVHLTLAFLGGLEEADELRARQVVESCAADAPELRIRGFGAFNSLQRTRVFYLSLEPEPRLLRLQSMVTAGLREASLPFDEKAFIPHLTLGRFKGTADLRQLGKEFPLLPPLSWWGSRLVLFESRPGPTGSVYLESHAKPLRMDPASSSLE